MPTAHRIRRGLAIVPENRRLFGPMTVLQNLEMGAYLRPRSDLREEFERVYSLFPLLYERRSQLAGTLSGGEQQMVAMGRALMSKPRLLLMDEPSMGLAPILVERSFEIIKQVNDSGVAMLIVEQNANVSLSIADRGYVLSTGRVVLEGRAGDLLENEDLRKAYLGRTSGWASARSVGRSPESSSSALDMATFDSRVGAAIRDEFPIFETATYLNSCSQGALSHSRAGGGRGVARRLGRERGRVGLLGRAERGVPRGVRAAPPRRADDVAVTTSVSQGVSALVSALPLDGERNRIVISEYEFPTVGQIAHAQELRGAEVVHVRPDADGGIPPERFAEAIDERTALVCCTTVSYRSGHRHDVAGIAEAAHARGRARARGQLPGVRRRRARRARARRRRRHRRHGQVPARHRRPRLHVGPRPLLERAVPTQTGWFADEDIFAMSIADYSPHAERAPVRLGHAARARRSTRCRGHVARRESGVAAIEAHVRGLNERLLDGLDELGATVATPREPTRRGPLVCVRSTDVDALVAALAEERSSSRPATTSRGSRSTSTTSRRTSTGFSRRSARHRALLA